jgi:hypothetical protein
LYLTVAKAMPLQGLLNFFRRGNHCAIPRAAGLLPYNCNVSGGFRIDRSFGEKMTTADVAPILLMFSRL